VELQSEVGVIDYTDIGRLKGHVVIGSEFLAGVAAEIENFPKELLVHLQHLVLSHHGKQEFGSPVVPMTAEALLLSFIDDMDAKMSLVDQLSAKLKADGQTWSDYQRSLERYILLKPMLNGSDTIETKTEDDGPGSTRQHTLF
jgi:3'-5' exoribonuclease